MTQAPRVLTPASRRWTFAFSCGLCGINASWGVFMDPNLDLPPQQVANSVVIWILVCTLVGLAARSIAISAARSLEVRHCDGASAHTERLTHLMLCGAEWMGYAAMLDLVLGGFAHGPLGYLAPPRMVGMESPFVLGATMWPTAAAITFLVERVRHRASSRVRPETVDLCSKSGE